MVLLSLSSSNEITKSKKLSPPEIGNIIQKIETATGWEVREMIRSILNKKIDSISLAKDSPPSSLYMRKIFGDISIVYERAKEEMRMSVPVEVADTLSK